MAAEGHAPHVLYVAWGFPPCRGGGVYRALATANGFAAQGFRVTVLTADRETFLKYTGADTSLEALVDPSIEVVRVPFAWPSLEMDVREWSAFRAFAPRLWRRSRVRRDVRDFPEVGYGPWKAPLTQAATMIHRDDPVDLVVASANPNVDFSVAQHLHETAGVPYVMDYRDAWLLDVFDGHQMHEDGSKVADLERDLIASATEVWFVNTPICAWHQRRYPHVADRMHVVANGYDTEFAAGWSLARGRHPALAGATAEVWGYLGFYATPSPHLVRLVADHADDGLSYAGPLAKQRVKEVYDTFDVALLILGAGLYVTSGKVFEYTASALPIVSVHDPRNAASDVLQGYPLWFPVADLEPETVAAALELAADAALNATDEVRAQCRDFAVQYSRDLQLSPRIAALATTLDHHRDIATTEAS